MKTANYKEALNLATTEIRKSKRTIEKKLAGDIKNDSKSFYAYVRSTEENRKFEIRSDHWKTTGKHNFRGVSNGRVPE